MAIPFLQSIAMAYSNHATDLSGYLFVFPNRRACTFFLKNLTSLLSGKHALLPEVTTMSDFVEKVSGYTVAGRIELLFILYESYCRLLKSSGVSNLPSFDVFRRWGETALSDFNEVDMQDVDPDAIFKNVKDIREISANFLTEEQLKVMEEFFGHPYDPAQLAGNFWKKFIDKEDHELNSKFRLLWQVLAPLYHEMSDALEAKRLVSSGGAYRKASEVLEKEIPACISASKIVVVGFNALTRAERRIFDALVSYTTDDGLEPFAEFFWDTPGPVIADRSSAAGRYVQYGKDRWPSPEWALPFLKMSDVEGMPESMKVIAVPSNSLQTKAVADVLSDFGQRLPPSDFSEAKVAVVLPDERLLIPMLYSLPENIKDVNLTMGYPLKLSGVATFVSLLRRMQSSRRKAGNGVGYYYKDLDLVLSHPFSQVLFGKEVTKMKEWIKKHHRAIVDIGEFRNIAPLAVTMLSPLNEDGSHHDVAVWLDNILKGIVESLDKDGGKNLRNNVDIANIGVYRQALSLVLDTVEEYGVVMHWSTFLSLTDRLISGETVTFEGQPLKGLQVMGLLETRALDFERIIIPSLNERILPARHRNRTFISDSLRKAYGLPPVNYSESIFAYYFYRMISRAKEVVMLYDSRTSDGARSGDVSRYVLQLKYLYAPETLRMEARTFGMAQSDLRPYPIPKTPATMDLLSAFTDPGPEGRNLSATALTKYASCQLRFYFEHLLRISTDEEAVDYIDPITQGDIVHDVMQNIYLPPEKQSRYLDAPVVLDAAYIIAKIKDTQTIDALIRRAVNRLHFHRQEDGLDRPLAGSAAFVAKVLRSQIVSILEFDLSQAPFLLYGVEIDGNVSLELPGANPINMRFAIDRLDRVSMLHDGINLEIKRIVDYKTGSVHADSESLAKVFEGEYSGKNLLQLWLYANLFDALPDKRLGKGPDRPLLKLFGRKDFPSEPMLLELYDVNVVRKGFHTYPVIDGATQYSHADLNEEFLSLLEKMLRQIFNPEEPFMPATDLATCRLCPFKTICWR